MGHSGKGMTGQRLGMKGRPDVREVLDQVILDFLSYFSNPVVNIE